MKALLLENIHPQAVRVLNERGIEVVTVKGALDEPELVEAVRSNSVDTHSLATVMGSRKRRGPALPGLR